MKLVIGIMFLVFGLYLFILILKGEAKSKGGALLAAAICVCTGALMSGLAFFGYDELSSTVMIITLGGIAVSVSISDIIPLVKCSLEVEGEFLGVKTKPIKMGVRYETKFSYVVSGQAYKSKSIDNFSKRYVTKKYEEGKRYPIYVDPKNPEKFVNTRMVAIDTILVLITGIMLIGLACVFYFKVI